MRASCGVRSTSKAVIHTAGVSPHMGDGAYIWKINACGTVNSDECSYLDGVDILYDGGSIAALEVHKAQD